jgi:hypothetical protein
MATAAAVRGPVAPLHTERPELGRRGKVPGTACRGGGARQARRFPAGSRVINSAGLTVSLAAAAPPGRSKLAFRANWDVSVATRQRGACRPPDTRLARQRCFCRQFCGRAAGAAQPPPRKVQFTLSSSPPPRKAQFTLPSSPPPRREHLLCLLRLRRNGSGGGLVGRVDLRGERPAGRQTQERVRVSRASGGRGALVSQRRTSGRTTHCSNAAANR